jgi:hypothetical protein
VEETCMKV